MSKGISDNSDFLHPAGIFGTFKGADAQTGLLSPRDPGDLIFRDGHFGEDPVDADDGDRGQVGHRSHARVDRPPADDPADRGDQPAVFEVLFRDRRRRARLLEIGLDLDPLDLRQAAALVHRLEPAPGVLGLLQGRLGHLPCIPAAFSVEFGQQLALAHRFPLGDQHTGDVAHSGKAEGNGLARLDGAAVGQGVAGAERLRPGRLDRHGCGSYILLTIAAGTTGQEAGRYKQGSNSTSFHLLISCQIKYRWQSDGRRCRSARSPRPRERGRG
ncbi:MAG: hypothetical protein BWY77_00469 [bacterium ADurb.Bin431]|nr:MAG: hypothetical protein BWY77_00469 [bacterium ADurb.Bin431]